MLERDFELLGEKELAVFNEAHPKPLGKQVGLPHEKALNEWWAEDSDRPIQALLNPKTPEQLAKTREVVGGALNVMIGRGLPSAGEVNFELVGKETRDGFMELSGLVQNTEHGEEIPASFLYPLGSWSGHLVIWLSPDGKKGVFQSGDKPINEVRRLLKQGVAVMGLDLFAHGEFLKSAALAKSKGNNADLIYSKNQNVKLPANSWQRSPVYYYGYNHSTFARRVHDVLTAVAFAQHSENYDVKKIFLVAPKGAGHWAAAARAVVGGEVIQKAWIDTSGFRFANLKNHWDANFLPGAVKYGDIAGLLTLNAPFDTVLIDEEVLTESLKKLAAETGGKVFLRKDLVAYFLK